MVSSGVHLESVKATGFDSISDLPRLAPLVLPNEVLGAPMSLVARMRDCYPSQIQPFLLKRDLADPLQKTVSVNENLIYWTTWFWEDHYRLAAGGLL